MNKDRFVANRFGFVDFWLYKDEEFYFENGRLLLRGANASGKSITTQSVIPFILDGDRRPERLDPFGSKDRKMEYYFLGNTDREDVTGYIYMEFVNPSTSRYITLGIGQRARKNQPMNFWGFILKDGRRIGHDFSLYNSIGDRKIPLSKQELKNRLGQDNVFCETQKEYEENVNRHLFFFEHQEEYKRLINLLIKVRGSKLSRDHKPTDMYHLLNDSLPVLGEDELKPMVDGMEKLDGISEKVNEIEETIKEAESLLKEYAKYNRFILRQSALARNELKARVDKKIISRDLLKTNLVEKNEEKNIASKLIETSKIRLAAVEVELSLLSDKDIAKRVKEKEEFFYEKENIQKKIESQNNSIEEIKRSIRFLENQSKELKNKAEGLKSENSKLLKEADFLADELWLDFHKDISKCSKELNLNTWDKAFRASENYRSLVNTVLSELKDLEFINKLLDEKLREENTNKNIYLKKSREYDESEKLVFSEKDDLISRIYSYKKDAEMLSIDDEDFEDLKKIVGNYKLNEPSHGIFLRLSPKINLIRNNINTKIGSLKEKIEIINENKNIVSAALKEAMERKDPVYPLKEEVKKAWEELKSKDILSSPFYELIDFKENLPSEFMAEIEAALMDAGILDILVTVNEEDNMVEEVLSKYGGKVLSSNTIENIYFGNSNMTTNESIKESFDKNTCPIYSSSENEQLKRKVNKIIDFIFSKVINLNDFNGKWNYELANGYSKNNEEASFIGEQQRKKKIQLEVNNLKEKLLKIEKELKEKIGELEKEKDSLNTLLKEEENIPSLLDLNTSLTLMEKAIIDKEGAKNLYEKSEKERIKIENEYNIKNTNIIAISRDLPYKRNVKEYQEVISEMEEYNYTLLKIKETIKDYETSMELLKRKLKN